MEFKWPEIEIEKLTANSKNAIAMGPFGSRIKTDNFVEYGVPIIKGQNLTHGWLSENEFSYLTEAKSEELKSSVAKRGDLVFTHRGTLGQVGYIHDASKFNKYIVSQSQMKLSVDREKVQPLYLFYFFKSRIGQYRLLQNKSQTGVPAISRPVSTLKKIKVPIPPMNEQLKIVKTLMDIDLKIYLNEDIISNLEQLAQTLFKRWFVDFEFPNENGDPYKSSGGEMVESELGMIPVGWGDGVLSDIGSIVGGGTPSKKIDSYYTKQGYSWITPKDLSNDKSIYIFKGNLDITEEALKKSSAKLHPANTVLFSSRAPIGYVAIAGQEVATNQGFKSIIPKKEVPSEYVFLLLKYLTPVIESNASGSTFKEISGSGMKGIKVVVPPKAILADYESIVKPLFKKVKETEIESRSLIALRDTLLPKLLSGEIELPEEIEVTEDVPIS